MLILKESMSACSDYRVPSPYTFLGGYVSDRGDPNRIRDGGLSEYSRGRVALGHPHRVVIAGPISGQSDGGKWRDTICYTVEIMWLCNDPLLIDKQYRMVPSVVL